MERFFNNGRLIKVPKKREPKLEVLRFFQSLFEADKVYTEKEVNEMIKKHFDDYAVIRRYLVDNDMLNREDDGSRYRLPRVINEEMGFVLNLIVNQYGKVQK